jgi:SAM-dependent methyltransferase
MKGGQELKARVKVHWENEVCGSRYGQADARLNWLRDIARRRYELEPFIPTFARFEDAEGKRVLEIGIGAGSDFCEWCRHAAHATGVDLTEAAVALTRERLVLEGMAGARYTLLTADAEALPFSDETFDIVYSWGVLHHTPNTLQAYREVFRVLKPGGVMRTMIYHVPSWTGLMLYLAHGLAKGQPALGMRGAIFHHLESPGTKAYTLIEGHRLAECAGFAGIRATTRLGPGDLLTIEPSVRYRAWPYRLAWRLWPRLLIRLLGDKYGLYLLLEGCKQRAHSKPLIETCRGENRKENTMPKTSARSRASPRHD